MRWRSSLAQNRGSDSAQRLVRQTPAPTSAVHAVLDINRLRSRHPYTLMFEIDTFVRWKMWFVLLIRTIALPSRTVTVTFAKAMDVHNIKYMGLATMETTLKFMMISALNAPYLNCWARFSCIRLVAVERSAAPVPPHQNSS